MWQWREPFDTLLWLSAGGMTGMLARMGLVELFRCYSTAVRGAACRSLDDGALFLVLAPNMCGCFIAGLLSTPAAAGVASDGRALAALPLTHRLQTLVRVHVGLRTGFCGALTTWASWNQEMTTRAVQGDWARALLGLLFGAQLSLASLAVGQHAAAGLWHEHEHPSRSVESRAACDGGAEPGGGVTTLVGEPPPLLALSHPPAAQLWSGDVAAAVVLAAAVAGCVTGLQSSDATARVVCLAALCGPFGVIARWQLARLNGALGALPWLPLGTLIANVAACVFDAALAAGYERTRLSRGAVWGGVLNASLQAGIGGGLSTVSTAAAEASLLLSVVGSRWRGYAYLLATLVFSYAPSLAIYGGATRTS
jgi:fluoride ion exporter CrcB/FEX